MNGPDGLPQEKLFAEDSLGIAERKDLSPITADPSRGH